MQVLAVADRLMMLSGLFEKYRQTGGVFDGSEAAYVATQLRACAEQVRADVQEAELLRDTLFEIAETGPRPRGEKPRLMRGILEVIDGGVA